jgi:hypothetical protein
MEIEKVEKLVFKCSQKSPDKKIIVEYELEQKQNGWFIKKIVWNVDTLSPAIVEMFLPNDIVEQILIPETAKSKLND